ncbi:glycoside hydrolase 100 family protein [Pedobacter sandarakinus]|uniref:glycoside hydrolase 100 family protein n=1 Tax=Pedobacter sandarakinus TaxID=353156 RepID=UPI00224669BD|nr:glycoside hydrolase 100 family protein [Pedobacter sandarakinus]MCX2575111.1 hypothetical protein [Pedobacter sandarakinus]
MINSKSYHKAINLLHQASTSFGFVAAVQEHDNYKRVWTRDGVITSIAGLLSKDENLVRTAKATLETLFNHQHSCGFMPSNVSPIDGSVSYGGTAGRADNPSWAVIGLAAYTILTEDKSLWEKYQIEINKCFAILEAWEYNGKQLIYVPQSGDWADEYIQHGYILFDQLLRLWALQLANTISRNETWESKTANIALTIKNNYWNSANSKTLYAPNLEHQLQNAPKEFWLMGFNPATIYPYFDLQANTFAILLGLGDEDKDERILTFIKSIYQSPNNLLPSFFPVIGEKDFDMQALINNYAYTFRNKPHYFHNGGLWPVWNGWLVAALTSTGQTNWAASLLSAIHQANDDEFNECLHGGDGHPCGVPQCTWSAAGAIIAAHALHDQNFKKLFDFNLKL